MFLPGSPWSSGTPPVPPFNGPMPQGPPMPPFMGPMPQGPPPMPPFMGPMPPPPPPPPQTAPGCAPPPPGPGPHESAEGYPLNRKAWKRWYKEAYGYKHKKGKKDFKKKGGKSSSSSSSSDSEAGTSPTGDYLRNVGHSVAAMLDPLGEYCFSLIFSSLQVSIVEVHSCCLQASR
jgi:hypothetical protein